MNKLKAFIFPPSPFSKALLLFLEEAKIPYDLKIVNLRDKQHLKPAYEKINPFKRLPAIQQGDFFLSETNSIFRYLAEKNNLSQWYPINLEDRAQMDSWLDNIAQHIVPEIRELVWQRHLFPNLGIKVNQGLVTRAEGRVNRELFNVEKHLIGRNFLCGPRPTLPDTLLLPALSWYREAKITIEAFPNLKHWFEKVSELKGWMTVTEVVEVFEKKKN